MTPPLSPPTAEGLHHSTLGPLTAGPQVPSGAGSLQAEGLRSKNHKCGQN